MENYIDYYLELISPKTIIASFKSKEEFRSFCETRSKDYLTDLLVDFTDKEEYRHRQIIHDTLKAIQK